jgi:hypothetical protein
MNVKGPEAGDKGDGKDSQEGNTEKGRALALEKGTAEMYHEIFEMDVAGLKV